MSFEIQGLISEKASELVLLASTKGIRLATAESLTGGLIASALTSVPGSSQAFRGSVVAYASEAKQALLGVSREDLATHGAVSEPVAAAMALGALNALNVDFAVAVTGIAGPGGAEPGKPVGTVWIAVAGQGCKLATRHIFEGDREEVREQTVLNALEMLVAAVRSA